MPSRLYPCSCVEIRLFKEHFVSIHSDVSGQTHGRSKLQLPLTFGEWKENTEAEWRVGRKLFYCQSAFTAIQRDFRPPQQPFLPATVFVNQRHCHVPGQTQVTRLDSRWRHTEPTLTYPHPLPTDWTCYSASLRSID